jgi:hypothetical protein
MRTTPGTFNLWRGTIAPAAIGSCERFKAHLKDVVCSGNADWFAWLWAWLAQLAQDPTNRPGTCVVQRGGEGVGKGIWVLYFGRIFGRHFVHVQGARQLVGNFNKHLADAVLIFGDEAFWAGNKEHVGTLKAIITEPTTMCEPKFHDPFPLTNHKWLIISSNETWVFPTGITARRPLVLDVPGTRKGNTAYFAALAREMEHGGPARLLHELRGFDVAGCGVNLREPPRTAALIEQKRLSMTTADRFWEERLREGTLLPHDPDRYLSDLEEKLLRWDQPERDGRAWVHGDKLHGAYLDAAKRTNERYPVGAEIFWSALRQWLPGDGITSGRIRPSGHKHENPLRFKGFPPLARCRELFAQAAEQTIDWEDGVDLGEGDLNTAPF